MARIDHDAGDAQPELTGERVVASARRWTAPVAAGPVADVDGSSAVSVTAGADARRRWSAGRRLAEAVGRSAPSRRGCHGGAVGLDVDHEPERVVQRERAEPRLAAELEHDPRV